MCGIVVSNTGTLYENIERLKGLEYRGYDSAGVYAVGTNGEVVYVKTKGNVSRLMMKVSSEDFKIKAFMGHTRWATHGKPTEINAHPHLCKNNRYAIVHNGIVENAEALASKYKITDLKGETDTEILVNAIAALCETMPLSEALTKVSQQICGSSAFVVLDTEHPEHFYSVTHGCSLSAYVELSEETCDRAAEEIVGVTISSSSVSSTGWGYYRTLNEESIYQIGDAIDTVGEIQTCDYDVEVPSKGDYSSFMLKEIFEQPESLQRLINGRVVKNEIVLGGVDDMWLNTKLLDHITILGCGSSLHAASIGRNYIEYFAKIRTSVEQAAEFRYRQATHNMYTDANGQETFVCVSQSGETADVIEALKFLGDFCNCYSLGICNNVGSKVSRMTTHGVFTRSGVEVGVASTKTFTAQVLTLLMLALYIRQKKKDVDSSGYDDVIKSIKALPKKVYDMLHSKKFRTQVKDAAKLLADKQSCIFIGRGYNYSIAQEGALKMKELSYIHAEGYSGAELKHGPLALISGDVPTIALYDSHHQSDKMKNNIFEIQSRDGDVIVITDKELESFGGIQIKIPSVSEFIDPIFNAITVQLLSYEVAVLLGKNVDQPRNLAKSVTVE